MAESETHGVKRSSESFDFLSDYSEPKYKRKRMVSDRPNFSDDFIRFGGAESDHEPEQNEPDYEPTRTSDGVIQFGTFNLNNVAVEEEEEECDYEPQECEAMKSDYEPVKEVEAIESDYEPEEEVAEVEKVESDDEFSAMGKNGDFSEPNEYKERKIVYARRDYPEAFHHSAEDDKSEYDPEEDEYIESDYESEEKEIVRIFNADGKIFARRDYPEGCYPSANHVVKKEDEDIESDYEPEEEEIVRIYNADGKIRARRDYPKGCYPSANHVVKEEDEDIESDYEPEEEEIVRSYNADGKICVRRDYPEGCYRSANRVVKEEDDEAEEAFNANNEANEDSNKMCAGSKEKFRDYLDRFSASLDHIAEAIQQMKQQTELMRKFAA